MVGRALLVDSDRDTLAGDRGTRLRSFVLDRVRLFASNVRQQAKHDRCHQTGFEIPMHDSPLTSTAASAMWRRRSTQIRGRATYRKGTKRRASARLAVAWVPVRLSGSQRLTYP